MHDIMIFSGNANRQLATEVCDHLGLPLGNATVGRFSDGEVMVEIHDHVRGKDVFIIQPTCAPASEHLMELLAIADALRRASAIRLTAVVPYFGYARQDRRVRSARVPITAKIVADTMASVGIDRLLTVDLHADQIQGFFYIPVDNVYGSPVLLEDVVQHNYRNLKIVSPDVGGVVRARAFAKRLNDTELAIIDKRRSNPNEAEVMNIIGDVKGRHCVLVDDMVDTAGTLCAAAAALKKAGAERVVAYATHAVLSGNAVKNIENSELDEVVVTDTIPLRDDARACSRIRQLGLSKMLSETIRRISEEESVSLMFTESI